MATDRGQVGTPRDWLGRAKSNLARARQPKPDEVFWEDLCFDAQQAVEKALKAVPSLSAGGRSSIPWANLTLRGNIGISPKLPSEAPPPASELSAFGSLAPRTADLSPGCPFFKVTVVRVSLGRLTPPASVVALPHLGVLQSQQCWPPARANQSCLIAASSRANSEDPPTAILMIGPGLHFMAS